MTDEREDWQALVDSPGFQRLQAYAKADLEQHYANAANDVDDTAALNKFRQVVAAKRAVERILGYPKERVKALAPAGAAALSLSRGGG